MKISITGSPSAFHQELHARIRCELLESHEMQQTSKQRSTWILGPLFEERKLHPLNVDSLWFSLAVEASHASHYPRLRHAIDKSRFPGPTNPKSLECYSLLTTSRAKEVHMHRVNYYAIIKLWIANDNI